MTQNNNLDIKDGLKVVSEFDFPEDMDFSLGTVTEEELKIMSKPIKKVVKTIYLRPDLVKKLAYEKVETGKTFSYIIGELLDNYFDNKI